MVLYTSVFTFIEGTLGFSNVIKVKFVLLTVVILNSTSISKLFLAIIAALSLTISKLLSFMNIFCPIRAHGLLVLCVSTSSSKANSNLDPGAAKPFINSSCIF